MPLNPDSPLARLMATLPRAGKVEWIGLRPARDEAMIATGTVEAIAGAGLVGDRYKGGSGKRGITLIQAEHLPAIAALGILAFTTGWNDFLWPLVVVNKPDIMAIVLGLASMRSESTAWGPLMAATTVSAVPLTVIYLLFQRWFTQGIVTSGIKG